MRYVKTVLLVEDNPGDVRLTKEAFHQVDDTVDLHVAADGKEAISFLSREGTYANAPRPDLILLDLNLPKMNGREVLSYIKTDNRLKSIPTCILTTSEADEDIEKSYRLLANCYLKKPVQYEPFVSLIAAVNACWLKNLSPLQRNRFHRPPNPTEPIFAR